uniref:Uncharacterized protein n=1 Tax=Opuntia streptacantha TaxID=393608 RepID=A0A7C8Z492_OPUST
MAAAASSFFSRTIPIPYTYTRHYHSYNPPSLHLCTSNLSPPSHFFSTISFPSSFIHRRLSPIRLHRSFSRVPSNPNRSIRRCQAGSAGPPPSPPERPDSGPANQPVRPTASLLNGKLRRKPWKLKIYLNI